MNKINALIGGLGIGAGLMYLFDPDKGKRRRALLEDKARHLAKVGRREFTKTSHDLENRARGLACEAKSLFVGGDEAADNIVEARVRSRLGRCSSNPHAVKTVVEDGAVTLSGPILEHEADALVSEVSKIDGVTSVDDRLERHALEEHFPALQGHKERNPYADRWTPTGRLLTAVGGGALAGYGMRRGDLLGKAMGVAGTGLLIRSALDMPLSDLVKGEGEFLVQKTITIDRPVKEIFEVCSRPEEFPNFMSHVRSVEKTGDSQYRWTVDGIPGIPVTWETRVTETVPDKKIVWESIEGASVTQSGEMHFEEAGDNSTRVSVNMKYSPPAGLIGHAAAGFFGRDPKSEMDDDFLRMKSYLEKNVIPHDAAAKQQSA